MSAKPERNADALSLDTLAGRKGWQIHHLSPKDALLTGEMPPELVPDQSAFELLWRSHPPAYSELMMHGRRVPMPRWQAIYGADYHFSGSRHVAAPIPGLYAPWMDWAREVIEPRLNGLVVNWYDGQLGHYIGKHRDSTIRMIVGTPIVMLSFGDQRTLRMRPWKREGDFVDFPVADGAVVLLPYETNLFWTHEITKSKRYVGRRISITLRAFEPDR